MFIDTHTHLFLKNFDEDRDQVIKNALDAGVKYMLVPATDIETAKQAIALAEKYESVYVAVGVHPHDTKEWDDIWIDELRELAKHEKVVAIGEIGLDYFYDFSPKDKQHQAFEKQIELAIEMGLPIIIHNRDSNDDIMDFARKYKDTSLKAQYHCFAGTVDNVRELVEMGHYISFTGNITFKNADSIREVLSKVSVENILLETDSPFLTPVPYRGKRNEPKHIPLITEVVAETHHLRVEDVARTTSWNAYKLFGIGERMKLSYTYQIGESLYVNVTNRCNSDCVFCDRKGDAVINGYSLKMTKAQEPDAEIYISEIGDPTKYKEIVFCGYGEPTIRWEVVKEVASYIKANGGKTRINSDGHGNFINKRDITPELEGLIDSISISLNSTDPVQYAKLMRVDESLHGEMLDFVRKAKNYTRVVMSIVGISTVDTENAKQFVIYEMGVEFREREYF
jgi:TatD DNase family protein